MNVDDLVELQGITNANNNTTTLNIVTFSNYTIAAKHK